MKLKLPLLVIKILETLEAANCEAYIVGGAVRDVLMKVTVTDWDFTTEAKPETVVKLFEGAFYDNRFGTVGVAAKHLGGEGDAVYEITTFRSESSYSDRRRPDKITFASSLDADLKRRDFTINAMAVRILQILKKGKEDALVEAEIVDPFAGQKDLADKKIRAVGDPNKRFQEDALRMMRAIRIAAQIGFTIEADTLAAISKNSELLNHVARERVRDELRKIIASDFPKDGIKLLFTSGLLEQIIPELITTRGVAQAGHHTKDVWGHSLDSLAACPSPDPTVRLATLLHDIGKPQANKNLGTSKEITFYNHEVIGARMVKDIARRLKFSKKEIDLLWLLVRWHMFAYEPEMTDKAIRRFIKRVGKENIQKMINLRIGDRIGGGSKATSWRLREFQQRIKQVLTKPFEVTDLKINGSDIMKELSLPPGPKVGQVLGKLFDEVEVGTIKNDREILLKKLKDLA